MNRRNFIKGSVAGGTLLSSPTVQYLFNTFSLAGFEMQVLRKNVGIFKERGGTIGWMINEESAVVVDSQFPDQAKNLIGEIQKKTSGSIEYLINTHHHGDHTAGNIAFKGIAKHIVAHKNSKINQENSAIERETEANQLYPDKTFGDDGWEARVDGEPISVHYWGAAHTNGDTVTHFENSNVAHCGDLMFNRRYPYIDKKAGADIKNWINVHQRIIDYFDDDTILIFGHAGDGHDVVGGKEDVLAFQNYLSKLLEFMSNEIKAGKSQDEIMKASSIPGAEEWTGQGIQRSLSAAYEELTSK